MIARRVSVIVLNAGEGGSSPAGPPNARVFSNFLRSDHGETIESYKMLATSVSTPATSSASSGHGSGVSGLFQFFDATLRHDTALGADQSGGHRFFEFPDRTDLDGFHG